MLGGGLRFSKLWNKDHGRTSEMSWGAENIFLKGGCGGVLGGVQVETCIYLLEYGLQHL